MDNASTEAFSGSSRTRRRMRKEHAASRIAELVASTGFFERVTCFVLLLITIALIALVYYTFESGFSFFSFTLRQVNDYGIVIDAGSHGSRIHFYAWPSRVQDPLHPLSGPITFPVELYSLSQTPGISSMADSDPDQTGQICMKPLIEGLTAQLLKMDIKQDTWASFPIFLKATAGMRNLDALSRARIMNSIRRYLSDKTVCPFAFHWDWARVTAGEEEGVYGWLTVNNALGTILMPAAKTVGALDMGGASMQITFSPVHTSVMEDYYGLTLGGQIIRLYSHSFLGFGWGDAMMRFTTKLAIETLIQFLNAPEHNTLKSQLVGSFKEDRNITHTVSSADLSAMSVVNLTAVHPCYPKDHEIEFEFPSLVYPDGRFYVDVDTESLKIYMKAIGIPEEYLDSIVSGHRSSQRAPIESTNLFSLEPTAGHGFEAKYIPFLKAWNSTFNSTESMGVSTTNHLSRKTTDIQNNSYPVLNNSLVPSYPEFISVSEETNEESTIDEQKHKIQFSNADLFNNNIISILSHKPKINSNKQGHTKEFELYQRLKIKPSTNPNLQHVNNKSFRPLDAPLPLEAAPKRRYVVRFTGGSNFDECSARAKNLFYNQPCFVHSCSFNGVYQPRLEESRFIAFGQFSKAQQALNLTTTASPEDFMNAAREICTKSRKELRREWKTLKRYRPYGRNSVMNLCWKSIWSATALTWGYGFNNQTNSVEYAQTVGSGVNAQAAGWATGSIIYEVNKLPWITSLGTQFKMPYLCSLLSTILLLLLAVTQYIQIRRHNKILQLSGISSATPQPRPSDLLLEGYTPIP